MKHLLLTLLLTSTLALAQTPTPLVPTPTPSPTPDISVMVARIKAARTANKPFVIFLKDGSQVTVAGANNIALNPSGKFTFIVVFSGDDTMSSIPVIQITRLVLVTNYPFD
jgi:hypothetical protein